MNSWDGLVGRARLNLDVYAAAAGGIAGLGFAITSALGLTDIRIALALAQMTLSALAVSVLRDRRADRAAVRSVAALTQTVDATSRSVRSLARNRIFDTQDEPYGELIKHINLNAIGTATFFQYSGYKCAEVLAAAVRKKGARVTLYLQHEKTAREIGSERQMDRIISSVRQTLGDLGANNPGSVLTVKKCMAPVSVRAIRIDDQVLCVGWYTYEELDRGGREFPEDPVTVSGHDRPTVLVWQGTQEFEVFNRMFEQLLATYEAKAVLVPLPGDRAGG